MMNKVWVKICLFVLLVILSIWTYIYIDNYEPIDNNFFQTHKWEYKEMAEYVLNNYFIEERRYPCLYKYRQVRDICFPVDGLLKYNKVWELEKVNTSRLSILFDKLRINSININSWYIKFSLRYKIATQKWEESSFIDYITRDYKLKDFQEIKHTLDEKLWLYIIWNNQ